MSISSNQVFSIGRFIVNRSQVLGQGTTGYVYRATSHELRGSFAVKMINLAQVNNQVTKYLLDSEKKALTSISNPYVVKTIDILEDSNYCYIVMEECSKGTLQEYISQKGHLSSDEALEIFRKIINGYTSIIDKLFIHRDIKASNIMLREDGDPVIIDFGYCEMIMGKRPMIKYNVGSPSYMSPQAFKNSRYSEKSDIWGLGVVLYKMLTGKTLDAGLEIKEYFKQIQLEGKVRFNEVQSVSQTCKNILQQALQVDVNKRATIHKLKYIIDKSLIPKIKLQLTKTQSNKETKVSFGQVSSPNKKCSINFITSIKSPNISPKNMVKIQYQSSSNFDDQKKLQGKKSVSNFENNIFIPLSQTPSPKITPLTSCEQSTTLIKNLSKKQMFEPRHQLHPVTINNFKVEKSLEGGKLFLHKTQSLQEKTLIFQGSPNFF